MELVKTEMNQLIEPSWSKFAHTFGEELSGATSKEAIKAAGLDWQVEKRPIYMESVINGQAIQVPYYSAVVRTDNQEALGIVKNRYQIQQNSQAFDYLDSLVPEGLMKYEVAGQINGGRKIWILGKVGQSEIIKNDVVNQYLMLVNSHDGSSKLSVFYTTVRAICCNMIAWATREMIGHGISLTHTSQIEVRMDEAQEILGAAKEHFSTYEEFIKVASNIQMDSEKLNAFTKAVFPVPKDPEKSKRMETRRAKQRDQIVQLFENGIGMDIPGVAGTGWAAYNAVTEYVNHHRPVRGQANVEEKRFIGTAFGQHHLVQRATNFLLAA